MKGTMPTMKDVAQEAGVALGTVSKVFNGLPVGERYRVKVEAAAKKLGYQVNQYARGLRAGKTFTVALINMVRQNKVDGIIGLTYNPLELDESAPFVSIDRVLGPNIPCVAADNFGGGRAAAEKLIELGCRRLAFFRTGSASPSETDRRGDGFEAVCQRQGIPCHSIRIQDGDGMNAFKEFIHEHMSGGRSEIDGIFCSTDLLAWRIQHLLAEEGLRVPEDVQIIGFDGVRRFGGESLCCSARTVPTSRRWCASR